MKMRWSSLKIPSGADAAGSPSPAATAGAWGAVSVTDTRGTAMANRIAPARKALLTRGKRLIGVEV